LPCRWLDDPDDPDEPLDPDDPEELDEPDELDEPFDPVDEAPPPPGAGPVGIGGRLSRSCGMSGGGTGGWPLILSGPLALLSNVAQAPLPSVAPMLQATWRLPDDQLGSDSVL
jgi:hypothetical protein